MIVAEVRNRPAEDPACVEICVVWFSEKLRIQFFFIWDVQDFAVVYNDSPILELVDVILSHARFDGQMHVVVVVEMLVV